MEIIQINAHLNSRTLCNEMEENLSMVILYNAIIFEYRRVNKSIEACLPF
jgi:hypothetical protein